MPDTRQRQNRLYEVLAGEGLETFYASADTNGAPSKAQLTTGFGDPADKEEGWFGFFTDTHSGAVVMYLVGCDGTDYWYEALTKAT